jgi:hypothetical protein
MHFELLQLYAISEKNRQHNGQSKKVQEDKQRSIKLTHKANDLERRLSTKKTPMSEIYIINEIYLEKTS